MIFLNQSSCSETRSQGRCVQPRRCLVLEGASAEENVVVVWGSGEGSGSRGRVSEFLYPVLFQGWCGPEPHHSQALTPLEVGLL